MASGDTLAIFVAQHAELPSASYATLDTHAGASNDLISVLDYDAAADESAVFPGFMPGHYGAGGITVTLGWMSAAATSGVCVWNVGFKSVTDDADDLDTKAFAAVNPGSATTASAAGEVDYFDITFTDGADMDSVAAGEYFRMIVTRDADSSSDTLVGDAELVFVHIKET